MKESSKRRVFRAPFHDKVHIIKPLLQTTVMILFFSWFFYRSVFAVIVLILPGIWYFKGCVRRQSGQFSEGWICRGKCIFGEPRGHKDALWRTFGNVL